MVISAPKSASNHIVLSPFGPHGQAYIHTHIHTYIHVHMHIHASLLIRSPIHPTTKIPAPGLVAKRKRKRKRASEAKTDQLTREKPPPGMYVCMICLRRSGGAGAGRKKICSCRSSTGLADVAKSSSPAEHGGPWTCATLKGSHSVAKLEGRHQGFWTTTERRFTPTPASPHAWFLYG